MKEDVTIFIKRETILFEQNKQNLSEKIISYRDLLTIPNCKDRFVFSYGCSNHLSFNESGDLIISNDAVPQTFDKKTTEDCLSLDKIPRKINIAGEVFRLKVISLFEFAINNITWCNLMLEDLKQSR